MLHVVNKEPLDGNEHSYAYARKQNVRIPNFLKEGLDQIFRSFALRTTECVTVC